MTCWVSEATSSLMRGEAAAVPPSTARKPLVMATAILSSVYGTTVPFRLMMRSSPGAVAVMAADSAGAIAGEAIGAFLELET